MTYMECRVTRGEFDTPDIKNLGHNWDNHEHTHLSDSSLQ